MVKRTRLIDIDFFLPWYKGKKNILTKEISPSLFYWALLIILFEWQCGHWNSTPNLEHKVPKRSRKFIFSLFWVTKISKGREFIPAFIPNYLETNWLSSSYSNNSQSGALPLSIVRQFLYNIIVIFNWIIIIGAFHKWRLENSM